MCDCALLIAVWCCAVQCVAVQCSVLQCVVMCCSVLWCAIALYWSHDGKYTEEQRERDWFNYTIIQTWNVGLHWRSQHYNMMYINTHIHTHTHTHTCTCIYECNRLTDRMMANTPKSREKDWFDYIIKPVCVYICIFIYIIQQYNIFIHIMSYCCIFECSFEYIIIHSFDVGMHSTRHPNLLHKVITHTHTHAHTHTHTHTHWPQVHMSYVHGLCHTCMSQEFVREVAEYVSYV